MTKSRKYARCCMHPAAASAPLDSRDTRSDSIKRIRSVRVYQFLQKRSGIDSNTMCPQCTCIKSERVNVYYTSSIIIMHICTYVDNNNLYLECFFFFVIQIADTYMHFACTLYMSTAIITNLSKQRKSDKFRHLFAN